MNEEERKAAEKRCLEEMSFGEFLRWIAAGKPRIIFADVDRWIDEEQARQSAARDAYWRDRELRDSGDVRPESAREI